MGVTKNHHGRWWRAYAKALDDPKVQPLSGDVFKSWFNLCCLASTKNGELPTMADIAFKLRMTPEAADRHVKILVAARLIDKKGARLSMHDWGEFQYQSDTSADRTKKWRERHGDASVTSQEPSRDASCDGFDSESVTESESGKPVYSGQGSKKLVLSEQGRGVLQ